MKLFIALFSFFIGAVVGPEIISAVEAATIAKRHVELTTVWDLDNPTNVTHRVCARGFYVNTVEGDGTEASIERCTSQFTQLRTTYRTATGAQIEAQVIAAVDAILAAVGAGGHTVTTDTGN